MSKRYLIVGITAVAALWLYIDRVCFSTLADPMQKDLGLSDAEKDFALSAFFWTYALFQIPIGSLADRFGARAVLSVAITAWSLVTLTTGFAQSFFALVAIRLMLGITESGAYPAAAGLIKSWARPGERGRFSSWVALGGRFGGAGAPWLTATLASALLGVGFAGWFNPSGVNWRGVFVLYGLCGLVVAGFSGSWCATGQWRVQLCVSQLRRRSSQRTGTTLRRSPRSLGSHSFRDSRPCPLAEYVALRCDAVLREYRMGLHHHTSPDLFEQAIRRPTRRAGADAVDGTHHRLLRDVLRRVCDRCIPNMARTASRAIVP